MTIFSLSLELNWLFLSVTVPSAALHHGSIWTETPHVNRPCSGCIRWLKHTVWLRYMDHNTAVEQCLLSLDQLLQSALPGLVENYHRIQCWTQRWSKITKIQSQIWTHPPNQPYPPTQPTIPPSMLRGPQCATVSGPLLSTSSACTPYTWIQSKTKWIND